MEPMKGMKMIRGHHFGDLTSFKSACREQMMSSPLEHLTRSTDCFLLLGYERAWERGSIVAPWLAGQA